MNQLEHPNVPTAAELQKLRDKLRHFLPNELPEGTDTVCDICQKDFAVKYVIPSEDEEVAIQLPCKHYFGEHCINTWVSHPFLAFGQLTYEHGTVRYV